MSTSSPPVASSVDIKAAAHQVIDSLPAGANWEDLQYAIYVRQCIDAGLADVAAGRVRDVNDVRRQFGLPPCT